MDDTVKEILAYLRILIDRSDNLALRTCIESRTGWGIGRVGISMLRHIAEAKNMPIWDLMTRVNRYSDLARWCSYFEAFTHRVEEIASQSASLELVDVIDVIARSLGVHRLRSVERLKGFVSSLPSGLSAGDFIEEVHKNRSLDLAGGTSEPEEDTDAISVMSMHSAKGLTYDIVFIVGMEAGSFPDLDRTRQNSVDFYMSQ